MSKLTIHLCILAVASFCFSAIASAQTKSTEPVSKVSDLAAESGDCLNSNNHTHVLDIYGNELKPCSTGGGGGGAANVSSATAALNGALMETLVAVGGNQLTTLAIIASDQISPDRVSFNLIPGWSGPAGTSPISDMRFALKLSSPFELFNPLSSFVSYRAPANSSMGEINAPQSIVCNLPQQLVWVSAPGQEHLEADHVGNCAQVPGCRNASPAGGGSSIESYYTYYNYNFGNALAVLSCSDVIVAGGGYKTYGSPTSYFSKNAFAWRSSRAEGDRTRFLNRDVGCQVGGNLWTVNSKQCPGGSSGTCGSGTCLNHRARFAEATAISADASNSSFNIVGEMTWKSSGLTEDASRDGYLRAERAGFLWRGIFTYPSNTGNVSELSTNTVATDRLSDSFHLLSAHGTGTNHFAIANQVLRTSPTGGDSIEVLGVNREYSYIPAPDPLPTHMYGAHWQLTSYTQGQPRFLSPLTSLRDAQDPEFSTTLAAAIPQGSETMTARGVSGYLGTQGQCQNQGCDHAASRFSLVPGQQASISLLNGEFNWGAIPNSENYLWNKATAISKDGRFTVGHAYDARQPEVGFTSGTTGDSIKYGFHPGVPTIWSDDRQPRAIALPANYAGGIALGVSSYGTSQAIVVGTMVRNGVEQLPEGFVAVCTRGASTGICCSDATPTTSYLASKNVTIGANVKMFNTTAVETVGNRVYFTGTGREVSSTAKPYVAKVEFSSMCSVNTCQ